MDYADFAVRLESLSEGGFRACVMESPTGQGKAVFSPPAWNPETFESRVTHGRELVRVIHSRAEARSDEMGQDLFRALFAGSVADRYAESLGRVQGRSDTGLRIRLCFDPEDSKTFRFAGLPWELLCSPGKRDFLGCLRDTSICRYLEVARPAEPILFKPPLRIALLASSPIDHPPLELVREASQIQATWQRKGDAEVVLLRSATVTHLRRQLLDGGFHVLHFMGHGGFEPASGEGCVVLETESKYADPLKARDFADLVKGFDSLRLVVLNACRTAQTAFERDFDPFGGVAPALVRAGLPAVVAMQLSISDAAALAFSEMFYERLARGDSLDTAMAEGRLAIRAQDRRSMEWAIPVLFLRSPSGRILDLAGRAETERGLAYLEAGDLASAEAVFRQALIANPLSREARLYLCLCRLSGRPLHSLPLHVADELDPILCDLARCGKGEIADLARRLLGILRHEVYVPRRLRPKGVALPQLFRELEVQKPTPREQTLLKRVSLTRSAALLLNLEDGAKF